MLSQEVFENQGNNDVDVDVTGHPGLGVVIESH
jgi:hypothetical protein